MERVKVVGNYSPSGHNASRIVESDGLAPAVMENHGIVSAVVEPIKIKEATKKGYAEVGDSINLQHPKSKTRRGRVGKGVAQTLMCGSEQAVVEEPKCLGGFGKVGSTNQYHQQNRVYDNKVVISVTTNFNPYYVEPVALDEQNGYIRSDGCVGTLTTDGASPKHNNRVIEPNLKQKMCDELLEQGKVQEGDVIHHNYTNSRAGEGKSLKENNMCPTLDTRADCLGVVNNYRIRKLTPKECFRLMGVRDEDYDKIAPHQSNASLYHLAGDSIVVDVLCFLFKEML